MFASFEYGFCKQLNCDPSNLTEGQRRVIKLAYIQAAPQIKKKPFYKNPWVLGGAALAGGAAYAALGNPQQDFSNATSWLKDRFNGPPVAPQASPTPTPAAVAPTIPTALPEPPSPITARPQFTQVNTNAAPSREVFQMPKPSSAQELLAPSLKVDPEVFKGRDAIRLSQQALGQPGLPYDTMKETMQFLNEQAQAGRVDLPVAQKGFTGLGQHLRGEPIMPAIASGQHGNQFMDELTKYRSDLPSWAASNPNSLDVGEAGGLPYMGAQLLTGHKPLAQTALKPLGMALDIPTGYELGDLAAHGVNDKLNDLGLSHYDEPPRAMRQLMGAGGAGANMALNLVSPKSPAPAMANNIATGSAQGTMANWLDSQKSQMMNDNISTNWMKTFADKNKEMSDVFTLAEQGDPAPLQQWMQQNRQIVPAMWKTMTYIHGDPTKGSYNRSLELMMDRFHKNENITGIPLNDLLYGSTQRPNQ